MIHLYCGDGKGKTTAAMGLALRMAGAGKQVLVGQFFKNGSSSEIKALSAVPGVETLHCVTVPGLYSPGTVTQWRVSTPGTAESAFISEELPFLKNCPTRTCFPAPAMRSASPMAAVVFPFPSPQ